MISAGFDSLSSDAGQQADIAKWVIYAVDLSQCLSQAPDFLQGRTRGSIVVGIRNRVADAGLWHRRNQSAANCLIELCPLLVIGPSSVPGHVVTRP